MKYKIDFKNNARNVVPIRKSFVIHAHIMREEQDRYVFITEDNTTSYSKTSYTIQEIK